jgi:hypothetical protein
LLGTDILQQLLDEQLINTLLHVAHKRSMIDAALKLIDNHRQATLDDSDVQFMVRSFAVAVGDIAKTYDCLNCYFVLAQLDNGYGGSLLQRESLVDRLLSNEQRVTLWLSDDASALAAAGARRRVVLSLLPTLSLSAVLRTALSLRPRTDPDSIDLYIGALLLVVARLRAPIDDALLAELTRQLHEQAAVRDVRRLRNQRSIAWLAASNVDETASASVDNAASRSTKAAHDDAADADQWHRSVLTPLRWKLRAGGAAASERRDVVDACQLLLEEALAQRYGTYDVQRAVQRAADHANRRASALLALLLDQPVAALRSLLDDVDIDNDTVRNYFATLDRIVALAHCDTRRRSQLIGVVLQRCVDGAFVLFLPFLQRRFADLLYSCDELSVESEAVDDGVRARLPGIAAAVALLGGGGAARLSRECLADVLRHVTPRAAPRHLAPLASSITARAPSHLVVRHSLAACLFSCAHETRASQHTKPASIASNAARHPLLEPLLQLSYTCTSIDSACPTCVRTTIQ